MAGSGDIEKWFRDALLSLLEPHKLSPGMRAFEDCWALLRWCVEGRAEQFEADPAKLVDFVRRRRPRRPSNELEGQALREANKELEGRLRQWFADHHITASVILAREPDAPSNPSLGLEDRRLVRQWLVRTRAELQMALDLYSRCAVIKTASVVEDVREAVTLSALRPDRLEDTRWSVDDAFDAAWLARIYGEGPCDPRYMRFRGYVVLRLGVPYRESDDFILALYGRLHPNEGGRWSRFRPQAAGFVTFARLEAWNLARERGWRDLPFSQADVALDDFEVVDAGDTPEEILVKDEEVRIQAARRRKLLHELFTLDSAPHQIITFALHHFCPTHLAGHDVANADPPEHRGLGGVLGLPSNRDVDVICLQNEPDVHRLGLSDSEVAATFWHGRLEALLKQLGEHSVSIDGERVPLSTFLDPIDRANVAFRITRPVRRVLKKVQLFPTRRPTKNYAECFGALVRVGNSAGEMEFRRGDPDNRRRFARFLRAETGELRLCDFALSGGPTSNVRKFSSAVKIRLVNRARANNQAG